ncbi:hypothetical protein [Enterococcus sp. DIV0876]|uniref:hypothetical protein n=1 Tax=Enterococcus sp. DIV0876 TaxID=2774633 RepID=UPI003D2FF42B
MDKSRTLIESTLLLLVSLSLMIGQGFDAQQIIYFLTAVFLMGVSFLLPKSARWVVIAGIIPLCYFWSDLTFFLPCLLRILPVQSKIVDAVAFFGFVWDFSSCNFLLWLLS